MHYWTASNRVTRRTMMRGAALGGAGLAAAALIGCGDDDDDAPASPGVTPATPATTPVGDDASEGPRQGGRLGRTIGTNSPNFNPITNWTEGQYLSNLHIYDRLISPRVDERIYVLEAAESVEVPDDTTVVFRLREGMVYQDRAPANGRTVVADDIVRVQHYARDSEAAFDNAFQTGSMESVEAPDDRTVVFRLQRPNAYMFSGAALGQPHNQAIIPSELLDDLETAEPVGSGPYQLKEYQLDTRYLYEQNPTFRDAEAGRPYIDERMMLVVADSAAHESAFRSEQTHVYTPPADTSNRLQQDLGDQIVHSEWVSLSPFSWKASIRREPWGDERVRKALYRLTNMQAFADLVDAGLAVTCPGTLAVGLERYLVDERETTEYKRYDPQEARQLLEAAGLDFNGSYELVTLAGGSVGRNDTAVQVWAQQLSEAGIRANILALSFSEWLQPRIGTGNYDLAIHGMPAWDTPRIPLRHNHSDPQNVENSFNLADPEIDAMIERSEQLLDPEPQAELVKQIQLELLRKYAPNYYLVSQLVQHLQWAYVKDWELSAADTSHIMYRAEAWMDL